MAKKFLNPGLSFGITSGVITTLGLIVGLSRSTNLKLAVVGGIIVIAFADALSDSFGMQMAEESKKSSTNKDAFKISFSTFSAKLLIALTFLIPVILLELQTAVLASIVWGVFLISLLSYNISKSKNLSPLKTGGRHLIVAMVVVILSDLIGRFVQVMFNYS